MAIGNDLLFSDSFDRADNALSLGPNWVNDTNEGTSFGIRNNRATLTGGNAQYYRIAWLANSLSAANANLAVETTLDANGTFQWVIFRASQLDTPTTPVFYGVGKWGAASYFIREDGTGQTVELGGSGWHALLESASSMRAEIETDTDTGDVTLTLKGRLLETDPWQVIHSHVDSSPYKISSIGNTGMGTWSYYDSERPERVQWQYFRVYGSAGAPDTTKPVLSDAGASADGPTTAGCTVTTNEGNGTLYGVVTGSATQPTPVQVRQGLDHAGAPAAWSSSQSISSAGAKNFPATGLTAGATCYFHATHRDTAGNDADVVSSTAFTLPMQSAVTVNGDNVLEEGEAIALESVGINLIGATVLYLRHSALKVPQADLMVVDADSATASYVGAVADVGVPFTTGKHAVSVGITVGGNDHEMVVQHRPASGQVLTINPATTAAGDGSLFKNLLSWFTTQSLVRSAEDQCVVPDEIGGTATTWLLDDNGNLTGYIEQGPQTGTGTARYWLAANRTWYDIGFTLVAGQIDTVAPSLVAGPTLSDITQTTATLTATPNESGDYGIAVLMSGGISPAGGDILAGTVSGAVWSLTATSMTANEAFQAALTNLQAGLSYRAYLALRDAAGNTRVVASNLWTMQATDTTAPELVGGISITSIGQTTATLSATANENGDHGIAVLPAAAAAPGAGAILAGGVTGTVWSRGAAAMTAGVAISAALSGLTPGSQYRAHIALRDSLGNTRVVTSNPFTMQASTVDVRAPQFSAGPGVANLQPTGFDVTFTVDEAGQYRIVLLPLGAEAPSATEVLNGTGRNGATPIAASALLSMSANTATSTAFSNLAASSAYLPYVAVRDAVNNARVASAGNITTPAIPDITPPVISISVAALGGSQVVTAAVGDNVGVVGVIFRRNGLPVGTELTSPPWQWVWHTAGHPEGNYSIDALARDAANNTTLSNSVMVQLGGGQPDGAPLGRQGRRTYEHRDTRWFEVEATDRG